ncbi:alpha/beta hydrolase family protein [Sphingobacterium paludis]|uniref:Acetyl xylan esterase AXE1 n=1 Tax=Sphingobacterium paludis TaxID=1476465 RepID=A0A4V3E2K2_9SPHI|nr:acetylxylan esterase [Sphingobacterium paludis]TDS17528.1 acetyl xylan esterase AXE1 [Sphingobacterium paludis]
MWTDKGSAELAELKQWVAHQYAILGEHRKLHAQKQSIASLLHELLQLDKTPLAALETRILQDRHEEDYTVRTLIFQSQSGVFIPANLYIPAGLGPFPAILNSHGHWDGGKAGDIVQQTAQRLVRAGYVVLCIDAWGAGERGSQGKEEYHGGNLGASLLGIGTSLLALQLIDNKQAVNLLCSLPFVDENRIGAVGASGGGNQTLWITAYDERIKAAVSVVSVGTFEGYLLQRNCVCELLPKGLSVLEAKDVLSSIGPRFVHVLAASKEDIPAFQPAQMLRAYEEARAEQEANGGIPYVSYKLFDEGHHFSIAMQEEALHFFNEKLGVNEAKTKGAYNRTAPEALRATALLDGSFAPLGTVDYVQHRQDQSLTYLKSKVKLSEDLLLTELHQSLAIDENLDIFEVENTWGQTSGWEQSSLTVKGGRTLHALIKNGNSSLPAQLIVPAGGIASVSEEEMASFVQYEGAVVLMDAFGMRAQQTAHMAVLDDGLPMFHSLSRTLLWLGETLMGRWVSDIRIVVNFLRGKRLAPIRLLANRETAVSALCYQALYRDADALALTELPLSLMPQQAHSSSNPLNMAAPIPGILSWGDVSMLRALIDVPITIKLPIDSAGHALTNKQIDDFADWVSVLRNKIAK